VVLRSLARPFLRAAVRAVAAAEPLLGGAVEIEGNRLDPQVHAALIGKRALRLPDPQSMSPRAARAYASRALGAFDCAPRPMARVIDTFAPAAAPIPVRVYEPHGGEPALILWFHGGGGVIGGIEDHDAICRMIADRARCTVASVEYRLAPEHPHPAAVDDALAAWRWATSRARALGVDPARIAVGGDSFGGYLAAYVDQLGDPAPAAVALVYPLIDLTLSSPSIETFAGGFLLERPTMVWFREQYLPDPAAWRDASPASWTTLRGTAPVLVITAGFDPLRDEGATWADRLGARATYRCERDLVHGWLALTGAFRRCDEAAASLCADLATLLARSKI
jgi:acetyl esterase